MLQTPIKPNWPAPKNIQAFTTTRCGGVSQSPFEQLNLGQYTEDDPKALEANRVILRNHFSLPNESLWLKQPHQNLVIDAHQYPNIIEADGTYTQQPKTVCVVQTADCLPILLCNKKGTEIAALHGGWKSLNAGIIEAGIKKFSSQANEILAWFGPAICPKHYEVGNEVMEAIIKNHPQSLALAKNPLNAIFTLSRENHWFLDLCEFARQQLQHLGVTQIYACNLCTYEDDKRFYSYRRNKITGRMATLIWME